MKKSNAGFTLMELMVVIVIVAVLSGGALRGWQHWQQLQHLTASARQLQLFLQRLQNDAHWHNRERRLWWRKQDRGSVGSGELPQTLYQFVPQWSEVNIVKMHGEPGFYGKRDTAWPGSIDIVSPAGQWRVVISAKGRIRLCQPETEGCQ
ncbi:prepilin-type N-terminal cleavage/methylation domain-containing protein [Enterobacteriaceae bacterium LUAb1]